MTDPARPSADESTPARHEVRWPPELLHATPAEAIEAFNRAAHGYAKRLDPVDAARFLLGLDSALYAWTGQAAIDAERAAGRDVHPKHRFIDAHGFFVDHVRSGETVLDLGCGVGNMAERLVNERGARVIGVDRDPANLARARDRGAAGAVFCEADIHALAAGRAELPPDALPPNTAPAAICLSNVLEHLTDRAAVLAGLLEHFGRPRFLIRVPAFDRDWRVPFKRELGVEWRLDPTHETEYTERELRDECSAAGLGVAELHRRWGEFYVLAIPA